MYGNLPDEDLLIYLDRKTKINDSSVIKQFRIKVMRDLDEKSGGMVRSIIASGNVLNLTKITKTKIIFKVVLLVACIFKVLVSS